MIKVSNNIKYIIVAICLGISCYGFLIKLPVPFRKIDAELHALFFFIAAAFLNILFKVKKLNNHLLVFGMLFLFSTLIEFTQDYSNKLLHKKIHGNFDPNDLKFNLIGITIFSVFWFMYYLITQTHIKFGTSPQSSFIDKCENIERDESKFEVLIDEKKEEKKNELKVQTARKRFYWYLIFTIIVGLLPIFLYPFSGYFGQQEYYSGWNHTPTYQFPDGSYNVAPPNLVILLMQISAFIPVLLFLISPLISIYMLFRKKYKLGFLYFIACLVNIPLLFLSLRVVGWLIIVD